MESTAAAAATAATPKTAIRRSIVNVTFENDSRIGQRSIGKDNLINRTTKDYKNLKQNATVAKKIE